MSKADTKFPEFDENEWELISREEFQKTKTMNLIMYLYIIKKEEIVMVEKVKVIIDSSSDLTLMKLKNTMWM